MYFCMPAVGQLRDKYDKSFVYDVYQDRRENQERYERLAEVFSVLNERLCYQRILWFTILSIPASHLVSGSKGLMPIAGYVTEKLK